ncbi:MAG: cytochrome c oxidase subunit II [Anaerolineales bacterium]|nr:cytochrome c oxidase subunit II [Anaerolineales bacterium]
MRHFVIVGLLVITATLLAYLGLGVVGLLPEQASAQAVTIDWLFNLEIIVLSFLFSLITVPLLYSLVVFRKREGDETDAVHIEGNTRLEITWTVIPLVIVIAFSYLGALNLGEVRRVDPQALDVKVVGFQWGWSFSYPEYGLKSLSELYLPVNRQVLLKMESRDVIHSFYVPEFRMKQDLVPGQITELRVTPVEPGWYTLACAELCGQDHAAMRAPVVVVSREEFEAWIEQKQSEAAEASLSGPSADRGEEIYRQYCKACHSLDGSNGTGPTWRGLIGEKVRLDNGATLIGDEAYIRRSIMEPNAQVVEDFNPNVMPVFGLDELQIEDVIEFIKTLQ